MTRTKGSSLSFILLLLGGSLLITWPVWRWLWGEWWGNDYYSHGFLIVPIALYLAWRRIGHSNKKEQTGSPQAGANQGLGMLVVGLIGYLYFLSHQAYYLAALAMVLLIAGLVWAVGGSYLARPLRFPIGFLTLMIPLPFVERVTLPLALFTGICSTTVTSWLGLDVTVQGAAVSLPNTDLIIGAQCSGINSIIALLTLTTLVAYALDGPLWGRVTLVALSIPLAMLGNILRVGSLLFVARYAGAQSAFTFYHNYSGFVAFLLIFLLLIPLSKALQCKTLRYEIL